MHFPISTSPGARAVPPGRIPHDVHAPVLLLHTLQCVEAFEELCSTGRIVPKPALARPGMEDAYSWIYRQRNHRLPTRGDGALWFWAKIRRRDLVSYCVWAHGEVLLTCRVPREELHYDFFKRVRDGGVWGDKVSDWPENFQHEIESSWEQILHPANDPRTIYWQATTHELCAENVIEAVRIEN